MIEMVEGEGGLKCYGYEVPREVEGGGVQITRLTRLNVGCGFSRYLDCVNLDMSASVEPDVVCDVEGLDRMSCFRDDTFSSAYCSHFLEHLNDPLAFMQELARVCCPGAIAVFRIPFGSSDNAWEDPTHKRPYFLDSFGYFSQAAYGGADYGYRGDWSTMKRMLTIKSGRGYEDLLPNLENLLGMVMTARNVVDEMKVYVRNIKPIRSPTVAREFAPIEFQFQGEARPAGSITSSVSPDLPPSHQGEKAS